MTQAQLLKVLAPIVAQALAAQGAVQPKAAKATKADRLATKDKAILRGFAKKGIKNVVLMDRNDPSKAFNVRPFGRVNPDGTKSGWLGQGRVVKKGQTSVRGLFHYDQTDALPTDAA